MEDNFLEKKNPKPVPTVPEDDLPAMDSKGKYIKPRPYKEGGSVMEHKHIVEDVKKHGAGHPHHSEHYKKHSEDHKLHHEHVKAMCGGGKTKGK